MAYYHPFDNESILARFQCIDCEETIEIELFPPSPNLLAKRARDSNVDDSELVNCPGCDKDYDIFMVSSIYEGYLEISDINDDDIEIAENLLFEEYVDDDYVEKLTIFQEFQNNIKELQSFLSQSPMSLNSQASQIYKLIYIGTFSCVEAYLYEKFSHLIFSDALFKSNFIQTNPYLQKKTFTLADLYLKSDLIEIEVKEVIDSIMFHNFVKIKAMFEQTFNLKNFPNISDVNRFTLIRHDLVHRNGKNKSGEAINLHHTDINHLLTTMGTFIESIDSILSDAKRTQNLNLKSQP